MLKPVCFCKYTAAKTRSWPYQTRLVWNVWNSTGRESITRFFHKLLNAEFKTHTQLNKPINNWRFKAVKRIRCNVDVRLNVRELSSLLPDHSLLTINQMNWDEHLNTNWTQQEQGNTHDRKWKEDDKNKKNTQYKRTKHKQWPLFFERSMNFYDLPRLSLSLICFWSFLFWYWFSEGKKGTRRYV